MSGTVLVTGASGGIGEAFAHLVAGEGWLPVLAARNRQELERVAALITTKHKSAPHAIAVDLAKPGGTEALAEALSEKGLVPDIVVNNAGFGLAGRAVSLDRGRQLEMIDLNVRAVTDLTLRFLPGMLARGKGGVINLASTAAFMPGPGMAVYFATKAFVVSFCDALAEEVSGTGVTVLSLCPGPVATGFQARAGMRDMKSRPMTGMMTPAEVAKAGWDAFKRGARMEVPGVMNKITAYGMRGAPRRLVLPIIKRATAKMLG